VEIVAIVRKGTVHASAVRAKAVALGSVGRRSAAGVQDRGVPLEATAHRAGRVAHQEDVAGFALPPSVPAASRVAVLIVPAVRRADPVRRMKHEHGSFCAHSTGDRD
jgi:hypothetical protein